MPEKGVTTWRIVSIWFSPFRQPLVQASFRSLRFRQPLNIVRHSFVAVLEFDSQGELTSAISEVLIGIAVMAIVRSFSRAIWRESLCYFDKGHVIIWQPLH